MSPAGIPFIDISPHQRPSRTNWNAIAASGIRYAYIRACEGKDPDAAYAQHRDAARAAGVLVGAYIYWRPRHTPYLLCRTFLDTIGAEAGKDWDLPPCIDLEEEHAPEDVPPPADLEHHVNTGMVELRMRTGCDPLLYTGPGFVGGHLPADHALGRWQLWCANYNPRLTLPRGWAKAIAWQHTNLGSVPGYPGNADCNVWLCDQAELDALVASVRAP
jgi:GH25 family lysozyme M1 (1,4-beta-N-acetylmuramidase)